MCAVVHRILEIRAIMLVLARLRNGDTVESDVTSTQQTVEEIIGHARGNHEVQILSRSRNKFTRT